MKKVLILIFVALFAFTTLNSGSEKETYLDFDDVDYLEIVKA